MGDISEHFSRAEFRCKCRSSVCEFDTVDAGLILVLERIRGVFGPVTITQHGGCRCPDFNHEVGGKYYSQHILGKAADFKVKASPRVVNQWLCENYPDTLGVGGYEWGNHVDSRDERARW